MSDNKRRPLRIAMYPWFGLSHITSNLRLANKLAKKGHTISLFLPPSSQSKIASHNHHPNLISFIPISIPPVDGLPPGAETPNDVPPSAIPLLATAMDLTRDTIRDHLICLKPDYVFFDFTYWLPQLARELGIKSVYYHTGYLVRVAQLISKLWDLPEGPNFIVTEADFQGPEAIRIEAHQARIQAAMAMRDFGGLPLMDRIRRGWKECDALGVKTSGEMEGRYSNFIEELSGKPMLLAGPMIPEPPAFTLDNHFEAWLKGFSNDSVIYCALGSECALEKDQFQELLSGLELTGRPFLAALRPPKGYDTIESAMVEGFTERTNGKGIVHGGWVQQQLILKHPSVGCFITHGGAGSLSEVMVSHCQIVVMPQALDQFINAKLMSSELRVGVEVESRKEDGFTTKEAICAAVSLVMDAESEIGREVRDEHAKWRDFLLSQGLEDSYISSFIQRLHDLL